MIYFKICKCIKEDVNTKLEGTVEDLTTMMNLETTLAIKIGYTDDNDEVSYKRNSIYRTENPNIIHYKNMDLRLLGRNREESLIFSSLFF